MSSQVVIYFIGLTCTPIFINTFVVFVRLYWFERRFQNVVREARNFRRTRSRSKTETRSNLDFEHGVRGRSIVVLHNGNARKPIGHGDHMTDKSNPAEDITSESRTPSSTSRLEKTSIMDHANGLASQQPPTFHRNVTFADEVQSLDRDDSTPPMLPQRLSPEQHIEFLENQRNPKDKGPLWIPGPRDYDRGSVPEPLDTQDDDGPISYQSTNPVDQRATPNGNLMKRSVTIDEPDRPILKINTGPLPDLSSRKSGTREKANENTTDEIAPLSARLRARTGTFSSLRGWGTKENEPPTPYLSWQPTIGRNSAFVDLTEEQREELGGIEYRSLKTLAVVLVCEYIEAILHIAALLILSFYSLLFFVSFTRRHYTTPLDFAHQYLGKCGPERRSI